MATQTARTKFYLNLYILLVKSKPVVLGLLCAVQEYYKLLTLT